MNAGSRLNKQIGISMFFIRWLLYIVFVILAGCASTPKEKFQIQPPPRNNIDITQDGKKVGNLTGTTVIKGQTYYIFNISEPFCMQYNPKITKPLQLPPELPQFRDSYTLTKKDANTYCATGNVVFQFIPETKQLSPLIAQKKIDQLMGGK
jgi:hypothetical protein